MSDAPSARTVLIADDYDSQRELYELALRYAGFAVHGAAEGEQALALVRDNQVIHVEDLHIGGMIRNRRLARAISDAGWGQFLRIIAEKADRYGRTVHNVSRWLASSKTCSVCGHRLDELPLEIRGWTCPACRVVPRPPPVGVSLSPATQTQNFRPLENKLAWDWNCFAPNILRQRSGLIRSAVRRRCAWEP